MLKIATIYLLRNFDKQYCKRDDDEQIVKDADCPDDDVGDGEHTDGHGIREDTGSDYHFPMKVSWDNSRRRSETMRCFRKSE